MRCMSKNKQLSEREKRLHNQDEIESSHVFFYHISLYYLNVTYYIQIN
jgi:hypothetical protein